MADRTGGSSLLVAAAGVALAVVVPASTALGQALPPPPQETVRASPRNPETTPRLSFEIAEHDLGTVWDTQQTEIDYPFQNTGGVALEVRDVRVTCGCTNPRLVKLTTKPDGTVEESVADYRREPLVVGAGEKAILRVTYNPHGKHGAQNRTVTLITNDPYEPTPQVYVKAFVKERVELEPRYVNFGMLDKTQQESRTLIVRGRSEGFDILSVTASDPAAYEIKVSDVKTVEVEGETLREATVDVTLLPGKGVFRRNDRLEIQTNDPQSRVVTVPIGATVRGDVELAPGRVSLGRMNSGQTQDLEIVVRNRKGESFEILGAEYSNEQPFEEALTIKTEVLPVQDGRTDMYRLVLHVSAESIAPRVVGKVLLRTNIDDESVLTLPVYGSIRAPIGQATSDASGRPSTGRRP